MKLLTAALQESLPPLYSQEKVDIDDQIVHIKFFTPDSSWTWYVLEGSPDEYLGYKFFGWVNGHELELGYFVLSELESIKGPWGLRIERDLHFDPAPWSVVKEREKLE